MQKNTGFSLVEILITLSILGIVGMFTVPKILNPPNSSLNSKKTAMAKEAAYMMMDAYQQYRMSNATVPASMTLEALTPYLNYVNVVTTGGLDDRPLANYNYQCSDSSIRCLKLHNGGTLYWWKTPTFGSATSLNAIYFQFDPDSVQGSTANDNHPSKAITFFLYYDGKIRDFGSMPSNTKIFDLCCTNPTASYVPSWYTD